MNHTIKVLGIVTLLAPFSNTVIAAPIDLSTWSALTLDFTGGQSAGNWDLSAGNTTVTQTVNADPSFYLNNINQTDYSIDGSWEVTQTNDNDYMGFVFGYQNSSNFYLFDWKQGSQNVYGAVGNEGMTIKKYTGGTGSGLTDLSLGEFWENDSDRGDMEVLATNQSASAGWADNTSYNFHMDFNTIANEFTIMVTQGATTLWDVTVADSTFTSGQFGFYNFSQANVEYSGFEQEGGTEVEVSAPATLALLGLSLAALGATRRKAKV